LQSQVAKQNWATLNINQTPKRSVERRASSISLYSILHYFWSVVSDLPALISTWLRCEPCGYFRSECCTGLPEPTNAEHEADQAACTVFQVSGITWNSIHSTIVAGACSTNYTDESSVRNITLFARSSSYNHNSKRPCYAWSTKKCAQAC